MSMVTVSVERSVDRDDELHVRRDTVRFLAVPEHRYVMVDGSGPPVPSAFEARMPALYGTAYGLRFALKRRGVVTKVGPLEGLWWDVAGSTDLDEILADERESWRWTLMIGLPDEATDDEIHEHLVAAAGKLADEVPASLRVEPFAEGDVAQILHLGPYADERPTVERLHAAIADAGYRPRGRHHELYLGDPRRCAPERLRTLVRHPIER